MSTIPSCEAVREKAQLLDKAAAAFSRRFLAAPAAAEMEKNCSELNDRIAEMTDAGTPEGRLPLCDKAIVRGDAVNLVLRHFLRSNGLLDWDKDSQETRDARKACSRPEFGLAQLLPIVETKTDDEAANTLICLVCQIQHQLEQMQKQHEMVFLAAGGNPDKLRLLRNGRKK
ncbi:MAG: hypothetical protein RL095_1856 [Verrucomicrobiota bacterium]|jgi:hypothetical protein